MTSQKAFNFYFGVNLHFTNEKYSMLKYGVNTKLAISKFNLLTQSQKFKFDWLASKFSNIQDLVFCCIASQFSNINIQYDNKEVILESYLKFKGRREGLTYYLKNEISKYSEYKFDKLIFKYLSNEVSPEYIILNTHDTDNILDLYKNSNFSYARPQILKLMKYKDFIPTTKYLPLFEKMETI